MSQNELVRSSRSSYIHICHELTKVSSSKFLTFELVLIPYKPRSLWSSYEHHELHELSKGVEW